MKQNNAYCILLAISLLLSDVSAAASNNESKYLLSEESTNCMATFTIANTLRCFLPLVISVSHELDIDPALVLAIIHQESHFKIDAVSKANAVGLMQLKSETAVNDVVKNLLGTNINLPNNYIIQPARNITLGIHYIAILQHDYLAAIQNKENQRLALMAAYNGGIGTLTRWLKNDKNSTLSQLDDLKPSTLKYALTTAPPFKETRDYVQRVERHYQHYRQILSNHKIINPGGK